MIDLADLARLGSLRPSPPAELLEPAAIALAGDGRLLVVDQRANRVVAISDPGR